LDCGEAQITVDDLFAVKTRKSQRIEVVPNLGNSAAEVKIPPQPISVLLCEPVENPNSQRIVHSHLKLESTAKHLPTTQFPPEQLGTTRSQLRINLG